MTNDLIRILSDIRELIDAWCKQRLMNENEFMDELKELNKKLVEELEKEEPPAVEA